MINKIVEVLSRIFNKNTKYIKNFFSKVWDIIKKPYMMILPGQLAFFIILSAVPILSIITWIGSVLGVSVQTVTDILGKVFTSIKFDLIIPSVIGKELSLSFILVMLFMFYIASNGTHSIIIASDEIYGIKQRGYIKRRGKAILMTLLLCTLYIFVLLVPLLGNKIISSFNYFNIKEILDPILAIIRGPITWLIMYYFLKSIYVIAPDKEIDKKGINLGALFTTIFWLIGTYLYSYWINNFSSYDQFYGSLSTIAILMLWIYWLCYIFVIGLSLNVKVENEELEKTGVIKVKK